MATFIVTAPIIWSVTGSLVNTTSVTPPPDTTDPNGGNNIYTDTTSLLTGVLTGTVFIDADGDDVQDSAEGRSNVTVVITTSVGTTFTVTTDSNGYFTATTNVCSPLLSWVSFNRVQGSFERIASSWSVVRYWVINSKAWRKDSLRFS